MSNKIMIQYLDSTSWATLTNMPETASAQQIMIEMKNIKMSKPNNRVRAVDQNGRLIDMLS
jgi:predicted Zn-dependent protease